MPSSYSDRLRLELQAAGENEDTWGDRANTVFQLIGEAMEGFLEVAVGGSSDVTLSTNNSATDQARQRVLKFTGALTGDIDVIAPPVEKTYIVWNATSGSFNLTLKPSGGTGLVITQGQAVLVFTDGSTMLQVGPMVNPATGRMETELIDDGPNEGPDTVARRVSSTPAAGDALGGWQALGRSSTGASVFYAGWRGQILDPDNAAGDGAFRIRTRHNGSTVDACQIEPDQIGVLHAVRYYTSNATWTKPDWIKSVIVEVIGGGGGGGGAEGTSGEIGAGAGGGAGGYSRATLDAGVLGATESVTVGAGGTGGLGATPANGSNGGTTSFGAHCQATGGSGGGSGGASINDSRSSSPGIGGLGSGGDINAQGGAGYFGVRFGTSSTGFSGNGGDSVFGGGERGVAEGNSAIAAGNYGGGGAGGCSNGATGRNGGDGAGGLVIVWEYK